MYLRVAFAMVFGMAAFRAVAAPLEVTEANVASVIDPLMTAWIDNHKGPGAVVVVVKRDGAVFAKGYGFADIDARKPFAVDSTLVRPGSISKLFTGIAVMQLVDAGKLDLDRDVNAYIEFAIPVPQGGVPVTLRRLLRHRAGFEEHVKGLFSRNREPEPLGGWLANNLPQRLFPTAMSRPIPITVLRSPDTSSSALRANPTCPMFNATSSIRSACAIRRSASPCRTIWRR